MAAGTPGGSEADMRPSVALPGRGPPVWVLLLGAAAAAGLLFVALESRRMAMVTPAARPRAADAAAAALAPAPALYVPPEIPPAAPAPPAPAPAAPPPPAVQLPPPPPQIVYVPQQMPVPQAPPPAPRVATSPTLVVDASAPAAAGEAGDGAAAATPGAVPGGAASGTRARAGAFANRGTTIVQGTLIPAVLESALDSSRPGLARAIVSRDVRGFDGTRVLIPRGSRLIGEYRSDAAHGQKRALVTWVRLIRPDGVTIAIGSPAADPLGGTGIRARVDDHFLERFAGAILQSALDVGVNLASRAGDGPVIIALPGLVQGATGGQAAQPQQIMPTLTVRQGTSISIFVARDLDFTGAEGRR